jgi:RNA methyltransferase, TrmH family
LEISVDESLKKLTVISKSLIKGIRSLRLQKNRQEQGLFIAEGPKVVTELISGPFRIKSIFAVETFAEPLLQGDTKTEFVRISQDDLEKISMLKTPNQVLALVYLPEWGYSPPDAPDDLVLVLDRISDPGNLGSIIRTADWFGIKDIVCSENCVDLYNPKVVQATMGSIARVRVTYCPLAEYLMKLNGTVVVYGAALEGNNLYLQKFPKKAIIIIGSESHGLSLNLNPYITSMITIPGSRDQTGTGPESLNASVAAALICSEFRRQNGTLSG